MLKSITKNMFDVVAGFAIIASVFYLGAVTRIIPLPDNALRRLSEVSLDILDVLVACVTWLVRFLP